MDKHTATIEYNKINGVYHIDELHNGDVVYSYRQDSWAGMVRQVEAIGEWANNNNCKFYQINI